MHLTSLRSDSAKRGLAIACFSACVWAGWAAGYLQATTNAAPADAGPQMTLVPLHAH